MSRSEVYQNATVGVLVMCALVVTGLVLRRELTAPLSHVNPRGSVTTIEPDVARDLITRGHIVGPGGGHLTIVEFVDLQCPYCAMVEATLDSLRRVIGGSVTIRVRHFPLETIHPYAYEGALAAECAGTEGKFQEFVREVYGAQDSVGVLDWRDFAKRAGVRNTDSFEECVRERQFANRVREDIAAAQRAGVHATPSFVIGTSVYTGHPSGPGFRDLVWRALSEVD